jgi:GT2 family glycosyltransferase
MCLREAYQNNPRVRVVLNPRNLGFGKGVNEALHHIGDPRPEFVLLVNPDARLPLESLEKMLTLAQDDPGVGAVGPTIVYHASGRSVWQAGAEFDRCLARVVDRNKGRTVDNVKTQKPKPVNFLTAAVVLIRTKALEAVSGFDPAYFLYEEDLDLSFRLRSAGYKLVWVPEAVAYHDIAIADRYHPRILYHRARSRVIFLEKHFAPPYLWYALAIHFVVLTPVHGVRSLWFQRSFKPIWQWIRGSVHGLRGGANKQP